MEQTSVGDTSRSYAKRIADLVYEVSGQLIIGDDMRDGMIAVIDEAKLQGIRLGLEAAAIRSDNHDAVGSMFNRSLMVSHGEAIRALNPADILKGGE